MLHMSKSKLSTFLTPPDLLQRVVLTGGPGSGKTTVLEILRSKGYATGEDAARSIIRARMAEGLSPRPEPRIFAEQVLATELTLYGSITISPTFFERGVVEAVGGLYGVGGLDDDSAEQYIDRYRYDQVLLFPPWADIYRTDAERDHTFEHSVRVFESTRDWYLRFGYEIVEVPLDSPQARAEFVLAHTL